MSSYIATYIEQSISIHVMLLYFRKTAHFMLLQLCECLAAYLMFAS